MVFVCVVSERCSPVRPLELIEDRLDAAQDYAVNLKVEIEITALHEKIDQFRNEQIALLLAKQQEQLEMLTKLLTASGDRV